MEAVIGALYLDGGFASAKEFILTFVLNDIEHKKLFFDSKTIFQEMVQGNFAGEINVSSAGRRGTGSDDKTFSVEVCIGEKSVGEGKGKNEEGGGTDGCLSWNYEDSGR